MFVSLDLFYRSLKKPQHYLYRRILITYINSPFGHTTKGV